MKRILILCTSIAIIILGCAKQPDAVEENATMTYLEYMASSSLSHQFFLLEDLLIPESYESTCNNEDENIYLEINAEVIVPDVETLSIYRVSPGIYDDSSVLQATNGYPQSNYDITELGVDCSGIIIREEGYYDNYYMLDSDTTITVDAQVISPLPEEILGEFELTESMIDDATATLEDMGISNLSYTDSTPKYLYITNNTEGYQMLKVYQLTYMRTYDDVPSVFTRNHTKSNNPYPINEEIWGDEQVQVLVDEDGIVSIEMLEPYENLEVYLTDVKLLSFTTIIELMNQMIATQDIETYSTTDYNNLENMKVTYHI